MEESSSSSVTSSASLVESLAETDIDEANILSDEAITSMDSGKVDNKVTADDKTQPTTHWTALDCTELHANIGQGNICIQFSAIQSSTVNRWAGVHILNLCATWGVCVFKILKM